ncbi:hypothetical protein RRG08_004209 [Elysia crispata]|uniref:Uncharacterized protein n=1 Tax=Elysia crispata TaxID=231223 RepID=A0AAE0Z2V3_9GAST|nr:hypothetical protein RRG08_004209 [Elysia crispata]
MSLVALRRQLCLNLNTQVYSSAVEPNFTSRSNWMQIKCCIKVKFPSIWYISGVRCIVLSLVKASHAQDAASGCCYGKSLIVSSDSLLRSAPSGSYLYIVTATVCSAIQ